MFFFLMRKHCTLYEQSSKYFSGALQKTEVFKGNGKHMKSGINREKELCMILILCSALY